MRENELIEMGGDFIAHTKKLAKKLFNSFKPLLSKEDGLVEIKPEIKDRVAKANMPKASIPVKPKHKPTLEDNYVRPNKISRLSSNHMHEMMAANEYLSDKVAVLSNKSSIGKSIIRALKDLPTNDRINSLGKSQNIPVQEHMLARDFFSNYQMHNIISSRDVEYDERYTAENAFKKMFKDRGGYISPKDLEEPLFAKKVFDILNHANDAMRNTHRAEKEKYGRGFTQKMEERQKFELNYFEYMVSKNVFNNAAEQQKSLDAALIAYGSFIEADMVYLSQEFGFKKTVKASPTLKMQREAVKEMPEVFESQIDVVMKQMEVQEQKQRANAFISNHLGKETVLDRISSITQKRAIPRGLAVMEGVSDEVQAKNLENVAKLRNTDGLMKDVSESMGEARQATKKQIQENRAKQKL